MLLEAAGVALMELRWFAAALASVAFFPYENHNVILELLRR